MRLSCLQENLAKGLSIVGRAVPSRTTLPITQHVLLQTDGGRLRLSATNLEMAISTWVPGKVEEEGAITVPARLLTELVSTLPADRVDLWVGQRPRGLHLACGRFTAQVLGADPEEFPPIPTLEEGISVSVEPQALRKAISQVAFAAATEDTRPALTGVKVELEGETFTLAAADGFRLAVHRGSLASGPAEPAHFIVPAKSLAELNRLLGDQEEPVEITVAPGKAQALFRLQGVEMVSQLIQGTFPNYAQLIPQKYNTRAVVALQEFQRATRTASIFARDASGIVRLHIQPGPNGGAGKMVVIARAEELGENTVELDAQVEGEEARVAFNNKYLMDVLNAMDREEVALEVTSPTSPGVFRPVDSQHYVHVVMPMFVSWSDKPAGG